MGQPQPQGGGGGGGMGGGAHSRPGPDMHPHATRTVNRVADKPIFQVIAAHTLLSEGALPAR